VNELDDEEVPHGISAHFDGTNYAAFEWGLLKTVLEGS
jgi:hypothetical protein